MLDDNIQKNGDTTQQYGVLLYYKYTTIPILDELVSFYESSCKSLNLLGRVRLSADGVNVTVGGKLSSLEKHIAALKLNSLFEGTDFKLASCGYPLNDQVAQECGFTSLSIRVVKELVSFSSHPLLKSPEISDAGKHLSAVEFHSILEHAGQLMDTDKPVNSEKLILLDARNLYETRIGKFETPCVETLDPEVRQYSDLPSWIDNNSEQLKGKQIMMYCTGGIRCEMASAYIRLKGAGFENVYQLYGGIQRYLEQFPDGGFFKGKNFVFDHRISVGSSDANIMGNCLLCGVMFDDYSSRCRCTHCRMLVLICNSCQTKEAIYVCELCQKHSKSLGSTTVMEESESQVESQHTDLKSAPLNPEVSVQGPLRNGSCRRKLRILCLHGFRQNAAGFKGRTASLAKKLKTIAELVFVDAPHELPYIYQPCVNGNTSSSASEHSPPPPPSENCKRKFAWLIAPNSNEKSENDWKVADGPFDPLQYQQQTGGYETSLTHLKAIFSKEGPFDGILGFSQGAAMAALVCTLREKLKGEVDFRFAIMCSGFALRLPEFARGPINCPSLHVFGSNTGADRQIANQVSTDLASFFEDGCSVIVEHEYGHIIPTRSPYIDQIKGFLQRFV